MKKYQNLNLLIVAILGFTILITSSQNLCAQAKKNRIRINADYVKLNNDEHFLNIKTSARIDRENVEVSNVELTIMQVLGDEEQEVGKTVTSEAGIGKFIIEDFTALKPDSLGVYHLLVSFEGNDAFKRASREVSFKNVDILTELITKDSINYISAKLIDTALDTILADLPLTVQVKRLFKPLKLGEEFYMTDENGTIEVAVEDGIPGIEGNLTLEVVLKDSDDYGTVSSSLIAPIGKKIVTESTYDQRTMWSPRGKTPIFLLFLTFSFIIIVWGIFVYLFRNLIKIVKS